MIIRDVLAHQAGLFPWIPFYQKTLVKDTSDNSVKLRDTLYSNQQTNVYTLEVAKDIFLHNSYTDSIIKQLVNRPLLEDKKYRYSDLGYYLLKELIENHYDKPLNVIVDSLFYKSIGVDKFGYLPKNRIHLNSIIPTEHDMFFRKQLVHGYVHDQGAAMFGGVAGHAGIFSNANDLAKIMYVYLNNGEYAELSIFQKKSYMIFHLVNSLKMIIEEEQDLISQCYKKEIQVLHVMEFLMIASDIVDLLVL